MTLSHKYTWLLVLITLAAFSLSDLIFPTAAYAERASEEVSTQKKKKRRRRTRRKRKRRKKKSETIDLSALNERPKQKKRRRSSGPLFKAYFDTLLTHRPGRTFTFDSFHTILLFDYMPNQYITFSSEIPFGSGRPTPRFYEVDWKISKKITFRIGRIWIPFDNTHPHQTFGGIMNTSEFGEATAFLPDLWADLGLGLKIRLVDRPGLKMDGDIYIVNGFGDTGGTDPLGETSSYPNFSDTSPATPEDNNDAKSIGGRVHATFSNMVGTGVSFYTGTYSSNGVTPAGSILAIGVDAQLRLPSKTDFRLGYIYMNVGVPGGTTRTSFLRAGFYAEARQRFSRKFSVMARGGVQQPDNGVVDVSDRTIIGGRVAYNFNPMFQISFEHFQDLESTAGKVNKQYSGLRFVVKM